MEWPADQEEGRISPEGPGRAPHQRVRPLRTTVGQIKNVNDLRRTATTLARYFNLPGDPIVKVGYVAWQGPSTPPIELAPTSHGYFVLARWAVRGKYRWPIEALEYQIVRAVGMWLDAHRRRTLPKEGRPGLFDDAAINETVMAWYGSDIADKMIAAREASWRNEKRVLLVAGLLILLVIFASWLLSF